MMRRNPGRPGLLCLLLAAGTLAAADARRPLAEHELSTLRAQQPARVQALKAGLLARRGELGLGAESDLQLLRQSTDEFGVTHARFQQTWRGVPVWNARALAHVDARGEALPAQAALQAGIDLDVRPGLSAEEAVRRASAALPGDARTFAAPRADLVVFPTKYADGLKLARDPQTGYMRLDETWSVPTERPAEPFRLAYHVVTRTHVPGKGLQVAESIVDANTGAVLKRWDGTEHLGPATLAAKGTGHTEYSGDVALDTNSLDLGGGGTAFELRDVVRATQEHPLAWAFPEFEGVGSQTLYLTVDGFIGKYQDADDVWGDGAVYADPGVPDDANGQTAAADAHFGLQSTWDYYQRIFGRNGIDDLGTSAVSLVHVTNLFGGRWDNASWSTDLFLMQYGDGVSFTPLTCLDVAGHEMSHGVMAFTAGLTYAGESGGLNESNSDIHGTMVEFYARAGGGGSIVPNHGGNWTMGEQLSPQPLRYLYKPSLDGASYDAWFDGIGLDDVHYSSGPGNRFYYFLSQGTGADADRKSPYLPGGMSGVGNNDASRIWYRAMSHYVADPDSDYHAIRSATLAAAKELYGDMCGQYFAVQNAWAAVNVGGPAGGPEPVTVRLPTYPDNPGYVGDRIQIVPAGRQVRMQAEVSNASDPRVTWSLGGLSFLYPQGGAVTPDGVFTAPIRTGYAYPVKATSVQAPLQFAVGLNYAVNLDADDDTVVDATDMGTLALSWGLLDPLTPGADLTGNGAVNDNDVAAFTQAFKNAYAR